MEVRSLEYPARSARTLRELPIVRQSVTGATLHFDRNRARAYAQIDIDAWRDWAERVKSHALTHLDRYLDHAAEQLGRNGVLVHWAADAAEARAALAAIAERHGARKAVKGKSMVSEELDINPLLQRMGVEVFETDLGEYILQLLDEPPSHILGPAIHRSLDEVRQLFHQRFGTPIDASPDTLAGAARSVLRDAFLSADLGITGGNFVIAETGTIALIENEGNIRLSTSVPRVHVAIIGIEKLLPRWQDLAGFLQLTSRAATGQPVGTFVSVIRGPRALDASPGAAAHGPEEVHVIFVDNGRSRVLADPGMWEMLRCVRCGACLNVCPVYRQTGGHAYGWVYSGPIGAVLNPGLLGLDAAHTLPFASTLCGACADVCPVRIPIPKQLLEWRTRTVEAGLRPPAEARLMSAFATAAARPRLFRAAGRLLGLLPRPVRDSLPLLRSWAAERAGLEPAVRSFLDRWRASVASRAGRRTSSPGPGAAGAGKGQARRAGRGSRQEASEADGPVRPGRRAFAGGIRGGGRADPAIADGRTGREAIHQAVTEALAGRTRAAHPGPLQASDGAAGFGAGADGTRRARLGQDECELRFVEQWRANGGEVERFENLEQARAWLTGFVRGFDGAAVGHGVPASLAPVEAGLPVRDPRLASLGVSIAAAAAAETGTLLLDSRDGRLVQILPPTHLVWLHAERIHSTLADALDAVRSDLPAAMGLHSGPSRSADIGRVVVTGVHGPGRVVAAIVSPSVVR